MVILLDSLGFYLLVFPFASPGAKVNPATLAAAMAAVYSLSFAAGVTGTWLLWRKAKHAPQSDIDAY